MEVGGIETSAISSHWHPKAVLPTGCPVLVCKYLSIVADVAIDDLCVCVTEVGSRRDV